MKRLAPSGQPLPSEKREKLSPFHTLPDLPHTCHQLIFSFLASFPTAESFFKFLRPNDHSEEASDVNEDDHSEDHARETCEFDKQKDLFKPAPHFISKDLVALSLTSKHMFLNCTLYCYLENEIIRVIHHVRDDKSACEIFQNAQVVAKYYRNWMDVATLKEQKVKEWEIFLSSLQETLRDELKTKLVDLIDYSMHREVKFEKRCVQYVVCHIHPEIHLMFLVRNTWYGCQFDTLLYTNAESIKLEVLKDMKQRLQLPIPSSCDDEEWDECENEEEHVDPPFLFDRDANGNMKVMQQELNYIREKLNIGVTIEDTQLVQCLVNILPWKTCCDSSNQPLSIKQIKFKTKEGKPHQPKKSQISAKSSVVEPFFKNICNDIINYILEFVHSKHVMNFSLTCKAFHNLIYNSGWMFALRLEKMMKTIKSTVGNGLADSFFRKVLKHLKTIRYEYYVATMKVSIPYPVTYLKIKYYRDDYKSYGDVVMKIGNVILQQDAFDDEGCNSRFSIDFKTKAENSNIMTSPFTCMDGKLRVFQSAIRDIRYEIHDCDDCDEELVRNIIKCLPWDDNWNFSFYSHIIIDKSK